MRIAVLDDDEDARDLLCRMFERARIEVECFGRGADLLVATFKGFRDGRPFGLYVLDCALPIFDGVTINQILKLAESTGSFGRAVVIYHTAKDKTMQNSGLLESTPYDHYLVKPEGTLQLLDLVRKYLAA